MSKGVLRFFFDTGSGCCLWAGNKETHDKLGCYPVDATFYDLNWNISEQPKIKLSYDACLLRDQLDVALYKSLNPIHQSHPCLWTQSLWDIFNAKVDKLLSLIQIELGDEYDILDEQIRFSEDPRLYEYLAENPNLSAVTELAELSS